MTDPEVVKKAWEEGWDGGRAEERRAIVEWLKGEVGEVQQCADTYASGDAGDPRWHLSREAGHYRRIVAKIESGAHRASEEKK